ncbi:prepilin-type N-terminal cleavage/methylation domain-containing protein [Thermosipho atlanticus]|uniref:Prepilin-type N-terminal cleavage/methylation domain-containing protein n=1 Tax=Thermosipho atlanticus DSM 15807 TaxID=1123380 RepID=A0A1M5TNI2_9BACT|nr:prepilin-type N-terminal cleavage/methylation domain-containing protein [Thermosipho atlanticus]SHH52221.1 prepilin-type N-terminal cleavage/methylation domain-containing protein [Thermosipho atlanticus DSM 15807]
MEKYKKKQFKNGFTLIELLIILAIIAALMLIVAFSYPKIVERSIINTLKANQKVLMEAVVSIVFDSTLPSYENATNPFYLRNELKAKLTNTGIKIYNPLNKNSEIITTLQVSSAESAAVVISQRKIKIAKAIDNPNKYLFPLNAAESSKEKFNGALIIQICEDGYIFYAYLYEKIYNLEFLQF